MAEDSAVLVYLAKVDVPAVAHQVMVHERTYVQWTPHEKEGEVLASEFLEQHLPSEVRVSSYSHSCKRIHLQMECVIVHLVVPRRGGLRPQVHVSRYSPVYTMTLL